MTPVRVELPGVASADCASVVSLWDEQHGRIRLPYQAEVDEVPRPACARLDAGRSRNPRQARLARGRPENAGAHLTRARGSPPKPALLPPTGGRPYSPFPSKWTSRMGYPTTRSNPHSYRPQAAQRRPTAHSRDLIGRAAYAPPSARCQDATSLLPSPDQANGATSASGGPVGKRRCVS